MIFVLEWNPFNPNYLVSVGEKHIKFWAQRGEYNLYYRFGLAKTFLMKRTLYIISKSLSLLFFLQRCGL